MNMLYHMQLFNHVVTFSIPMRLLNNNYKQKDRIPISFIRWHEPVSNDELSLLRKS